MMKLLRERAVLGVIARAHECRDLPSVQTVEVDLPARVSAHKIRRARSGDVMDPPPDAIAGRGEDAVEVLHALRDSRVQAVEPPGPVVEALDLS